MRIDVHAHFNPPDYFAALDAAGAIDELSILKVLGHLWRPGSAISAEIGADKQVLARRVDDMDRAGVRTQALSVGAIHPYLRNEDDAARIALGLNNSYAALRAQVPGRFWSFAMLPLPHVRAAIDEVERVLGSPGCVGVALGGSAQGIPIDDPRFAPLWQLLDERRAIVYIHPGAEISGVVGCMEFHLAPDFVSPAEIAVVAGRMVATGHLDRYPNVEIVLATLGGAMPFLARRFDRGLKQDHPELYERIGGVLRHLPRFWVDTSVVEEPAALMAARDTFGADRIILGTDYARPDARSLTAVEYVMDSRYLDDTEKAMILDGNARRLFGAFID